MLAVHAALQRFNLRPVLGKSGYRTSSVPGLQVSGDRRLPGSRPGRLLDEASGVTRLRLCS